MGWLRGSTPILKFKVKTPKTHEYIDLSTIAKCRCAFSQRKQLKFIKTLSDFTISENTLILHLTESDSLLLEQDVPLSIQMRFEDLAGEKFGTSIRRVDVNPILDAIPFDSEDEEEEDVGD